LEKFVLERNEVAGVSVPSNLKYLDLRYVTLTEGPTALANVINKNQGLEILRLEHVKGKVPTSALPKSLRVLWIYGSESYSFLEYSPNVAVENLEVFQIPQELDTKVIENFDKVFPNLKYASLAIGRMKYDLLLKMIKIPSIEMILLWGTGYGNWGSYSHMHGLNNLFKNVTGDEHFVVERIHGELVARPLPAAVWDWGEQFTYTPPEEYDTLQEKYFESYFD